MGADTLVLAGKHVRLEPLDYRHVDGLVGAADDPVLYRWSPVPRDNAEATKYVETAMAWRDAGAAEPFAIVTAADGVVIGSTRFWNIERWAWPAGHPSQGRGVPDACEIGYTWLSRAAIRTAANTEAKLLMLTHAFEVWACCACAFTPTPETSARGRRWNASAANLKGSFARTAWPRILFHATRYGIQSLPRSGRR